MMTIGPETLVCDLLSRHPEVFDVFERHGMCEDCREFPPPVPIQYFAEKHCQGDVQGFLALVQERLGGA